MATQKFQDRTGKMAELCRRIVQINVRWNLVEKARVIRRFFRFIVDRVFVCSARMPNSRYRRLSTAGRLNSVSLPPLEDAEFELGDREDFAETTTSSRSYDSDSDLVALKISLLGDCEIGKTTFVIKYVGDDEEQRSLQMKGLNLMGKTLDIRGARIAFRIWDVGGDSKSLDQVPIACKDAVAILFMFDLTSRRTLNSIIGWYTEARKWNQSAIPILIGTKFDDFVQLPPDIQWTVVTQARAYARAMKATLFFSSATHNINVHKIFKFIMAKVFNLPWTLHRNLTLGEPTIDF
ncbi:septum-promoting GTP-binding protein 1-like [Andrographis paniculata]|uniref:septum-promoting GTP-binding protein 1-like n=1 Tax=Andrographis paniculata TaxID=175694 RepID=UPI0021E88770|nr:septum-promoting GTP-binding protein 1-like [Andrographis paniculata]